ncbi:hypothetical protein THUN1379_29940 [Paludibacterium sp. THUN1379]|nr:hypothetical protein THUN1379_29940 [Paludibacterium sp. THUN1379]
MPWVKRYAVNIPWHAGTRLSIVLTGQAGEEEGSEAGPVTATGTGRYKHQAVVLICEPVNWPLVLTVGA